MRYWWVLLAVAGALLVLSLLGPVDSASGQSLRDIVRESEGGTMPSQEEFLRSRYTVKVQYEGLVIYVDGGEGETCDALLIRVSRMLLDAGAEASLVCEFSHRALPPPAAPVKGGGIPDPSSGTDGNRAETPGVDSPGRYPDASGVLVPAEPGPLLSAWGFMAWLPDGRPIPRAGGIYEDADLCTQARAARQQQAPQLRYSACTLLQVGERERL